MEAVIKHWTHPYKHSNIVFFQNDQRTYEYLQELLSKKKVVIDHCCIGIFRRYNNRIIKQYGPEEYMEGLTNLIENVLLECDFELEHKFVKTWGTPDFIVKKSYMSQKNRMLLLEANQRLN